MPAETVTPPRGQRAAPLYKRIAEEILQEIAKGALKPGQRLLSVRAASQARQVSIPTMTEAYKQLEDRQAIEARPQSGYFVTGQAADKGSDNREELPPRLRRVGITYTLRRLAEADAARIPIGAAVPTPEFFPTRRLRTIMSGLLRKDPDLLGRYTFAPGLPALRAAFARRALAWNSRLDAKDIVVTNGGVEAISLSLRAVTQPGDAVAVETPAYYGFLQIIDALGLIAVPVGSSEGQGLNPEALARAMARQRIAACLLSTTVTNPTGATMPADGKRRLVELLAKAKVPLIEDATFADLHFDGTMPSAQSFDSAGSVLLCASASKTVAPGLRLGWVHAGRFAGTLGYLKRISSVDQPEIIQRTLADYLEGGGCDRHLRRIRRAFASRIDLACRTIALSFPAGTEVIRPTGGFLLWLKLAAPPPLAFYDLALSHGIGVAPGDMFSTAARAARHIRLNVALDDETALIQALTALGRHLGGGAA